MTKMRTVSSTVSKPKLIAKLSNLGSIMSVTIVSNISRQDQDESGLGGCTVSNQTEEHDPGPDIIDSHGVQNFAGPSTIEEKSFWSVFWVMTVQSRSMRRP
jgi:hypothetical protein